MQRPSQELLIDRGPPHFPALHSARALGAVVLACTALGCASAASEPRIGLSIQLADLELHLRDDPYRSFKHLDRSGRNVFEVARWKIERLQRERARDLSAWAPEDFVLEFAHARTLARLHRYTFAAQAYERVANGEHRLAAPARAAADVMGRFARQSTPIAADGDPGRAQAEIDARISEWLETARREPDPEYASLAREEAESWEIVRVSFLWHSGNPDEAIAACRRAVQEHRSSKLYPKHLLMLGDLHADRAREIVAWSRAQQQGLGDTPYEGHFESAVAAYELASEARIPVFRREAQSRLQALLTFHDGVIDGVY